MTGQVVSDVAVTQVGPSAGHGRDDSRGDLAALAGLIAIGLGLGTVSARLGIADEFLLFRLARVMAWIQSGGFLPYQLNVGVFDEQRPLVELVLAGLAIATHLSPLQIAVLPIGAIVLPVAAYTLGVVLLKDRVSAFLVAAALILNHAFATVHLGTFVYVWSMLILFAFVIVLWKVVSQGRSTLRIVLLASLFFLSEAFYQTSSAWMIMMLIGAMGCTWLLRRDRRGPAIVIGLGSLTLSFLAYYLYFDRTFQGTFLAALGRHDASSQLLSTINGLISQLASALIAGPHPVVPYEASTPSTPVAAAAILLEYALVGAAGLIGLVLVAYRRLRRQEGPPTPQLVILGAFVFTAIGHTAAYSLYGHFSLRVVSLLGGLMAALLLSVAGLGRRWIRGWALAFAGVSLLGMVAFLGSVQTPPSEASVEAASEFLMERGAIPVVTADLGLYGRLLLVAASRGRVIELADLDSCGFEHLITSTPTCGPATLGQYVVMDAANLSHALVSNDWASFGPPSSYWAAIEANPAQEVVYDSGGIVIFQRDHDDHGK